MTRAKWFRALLVGVIAAETAVWWSAGPRWRVTTPREWLTAGFSGDGTTVAAVTAWRLGDPMTIHCWDAATGRGRAVDLPPPGQFGDMTVDVPGDGHTALVWSMPSRAWDGAVTPAVRRVFDTTTGLPVGPAITAAADARVVGVSPDGRYATLRTFDGDDPVSEVIALPAGEQACRFPPADGFAAVALKYAADGRHAAVLRLGKGESSAAALDLVDLPAGRRLRTFALPVARSWSLDGWLGGRVVVTADAYEPGTDRCVTRTHDLDLATPSPTLAHRPVADRRAPDAGPFVFEAGPNWNAVRTPTTSPLRADPTPMARWLADQFNVRPELDTRWQSRVTVFGSGGQRIGGFVTHRAVDQFRVAPDGGTVVCVRGQQAIEVWDAAPPSPWPRAVLAGLVAAGGWAWLERRRARR